MACDGSVLELSFSTPHDGIATALPRCPFTWPALNLIAQGLRFSRTSLTSYIHRSIFEPRQPFTLSTSRYLMAKTKIDFFQRDIMLVFSRVTDLRASLPSNNFPLSHKLAVHPCPRL
jgi:hypothetical protein